MIYGYLIKISKLPNKNFELLGFKNNLSWDIEHDIFICKKI